MVRQESRPHNSRLPQVAVTWLIEGLYFYSAFVQVDSLMLPNRHLLQTAKRCDQLKYPK